LAQVGLALAHQLLALAEVALVAEVRDPEGDPDFRSYDKLVELSEQVNELRGQVVSLAERVARLEEENRWLRQELAEIKGAVREVRRNSVAILASILTVLVTVVIGLIVH
jgi:chromosome segregation ATPase